MWTDEESLAANAAGRIAPAQRALVAGRPVGPPYAGAVLLVLAFALGVILYDSGDPAPALVTGGIVAGLAVTVAGVNRYERGEQRRLLADLDAPVLTTGVARIVGREVRDGFESIPVPRGAPDLPPPGWYSMWWLDRPAAAFPRRVLLSIEPEPRPAPRHAPDRMADLRRDLLAVFGADEADLERNRAGMLTARQRRTLAGALAGRVVGILICLAIAAGFFVLCGYDLYYAREQPWGYTILALIPGLFGALVLLATGYTIRTVRWIAAARGAANPVARAAGPVVVRTNGDGDWTVGLDTMDFRVTEAMGRALAEPGPYALYHLAKPRRLLLAEPISLP